MRRILTLILLAAALAPSIGGAQERGALLVATEAVTEESFSETVILLLHYGSDGAIGIAINRPTWVTTRDVFPDSVGLAAYRGSLFHGGPLAQATVLALSREPSQPVDAAEIVDAVYMSSDIESLATQFNARADTDRVLRFYAGHASWRPGQLEEEIDDGAWRVVRGSAELIFDSDPITLWQRISAGDGDLSVRAEEPVGGQLRSREIVGRR